MKQNDINLINISDNLIKLYQEINTENDIIAEKNFITTSNIKYDWPNFIFCNKPLYELNTDDVVFLKKHALKTQSKIILSERNILNVQKELKNHNLYPLTMWKGMSLNINNLNKLEEKKNFKVAKVTSRQDLESWFGIVKPELLSTTNSDAKVFTKALNNSNFYLVLGKLNSVAVTALLLYRHKDVSGIYFVATPHQYRHNGYATYATLFGINKLFEQNCRKFILHSSKAGENIYKKIGFEYQSKIYVLSNINK